MTDNEIIKALTEWSERLFTFCNVGMPEFARHILGLINRQQAEIERLNGCVKSEDEVRAIMKSQMAPMVQEIVNEQIDVAMKVAAAEAIKETVEMVKKNSCCSSIFVNGEEKESSRIYQISEAELDNLVKEMAGE